MITKSKDFFKKSNFNHIAVSVIGVVVLVGVIAMLSGKSRGNRAPQFYGQRSQAAYTGPFYHCPNCNTTVPCPHNHNGDNISCPSCGLRMNCIQRRSMATQGVQGSNFYVAGGMGRNGGQGLGPGGNLLCPDCGYIMPHQRGVPCYTIQCPKCGTTMVRQLNANIPTAFNTMRGTIAGAAPPIRIDALMNHEYRGVCSKCHQIIEKAQNIDLQVAGNNNVGQANRSYRIGPGGCVIY